MFRGTTARTRFTLLAVLLLAFQLFAPTGTFAPAYTLGQAQAKAEAGTPSSVPPVREERDSVRTPGRSGAPVGLPHLRDRQRCSASGCAQAHPLIAGRAAGTGPSHTPGTAHDPASRAFRAHTPAALQVFRC
ncbi:hypothetical protein AQI95_18565 [Streptomyces yokosukanensis]|uniref:Secreted protein n=1 Tax=Streptomyces yokosukanensis TaxID=67386 RepID=A0A101P4Q0_9ACTN|nr:hypothetical protein [Streptomyces yokosukanensis]KUN04882.1 hypothetical protein AQI95_18565 [Streptomyces yokosukanensis]